MSVANSQLLPNVVLTRKDNTSHFNVQKFEWPEEMKDATDFLKCAFLLRGLTRLVICPLVRRNALLRSLDDVGGLQQSPESPGTFVIKKGERNIGGDGSIGVKGCCVYASNGKEALRVELGAALKYSLGRAKQTNHANARAQMMVPIPV
jgi:hypothetical protein